MINRIKSAIAYLFLTFAFLACEHASTDKTETDLGEHDLEFNKLASSWDEGIPLGNGVLGALIYQKKDYLRFSLDRIDLWDLRQTKYLDDGAGHTFAYLYNLWKSGRYQIARNLRDSLRIDPYPSKIPGAAIDFKNIKELGKVTNVDLSLKEAICHIQWDSGASMETFVAADKEYGWFQFQNLKTPLDFTITPPNYDGSQKIDEVNDKGRNKLITLGYPSPSITKKTNGITYRQKVIQGKGYTVYLKWATTDYSLKGIWSIANNNLECKQQLDEKQLENLLKQSKSELLRSHKDRWNKFWAKSAISVPDSIIQSQWVKDMYKFGACTGISKIPISLQAIWTADNGKMPPWSGNFTNDLNTEESYWGAFNGNHLAETKIFVDWLWKLKPEAERYTKKFFGVNGLAFPGISTIEGGAMVSWWPYVHSPSISAWLGQNFYWYWRYSMDRDFLKNRAYPWLKETTIFFDNFSVTDTMGKKRLPLSSSPEINDDKAEAWFSKTTNHDLALIRWVYNKAIELATELGELEDVRHFKEQLSQWPKLAVSDKEGLLIAPDYPLAESHRHFGHLMAIYPLAAIDISQGNRSKTIIANSLDHLDGLGTKEWVGWSIPWYGLLRARQGNGEKAAEYLRVFAENFCGPNSFHLNGDQSGKGYSNFTYRPFTLEGNFGFIGNVNEMLIQSHTGIVRLFPAIPNSWKNVSFNTLRTTGAFLVSAEMKNGKVTKVEIASEAGGVISLSNPFSSKSFENTNKRFKIEETDKLIKIHTIKGEKTILLTTVVR